MPARGKLTIWGIYEYDPALFEDLELPEGVDADITRHRILLECGQLEIIYPDPAFLKESIKWWSKANLLKWTKLHDTETIEYNPIWNVDGTESESIERYKSEDRSSVRSRDEGVTATDTSSLQGFNSNTFNGVTQVGGSTTTDDDETITQDNDESEAVTTTRRRTGNIGVTTTQHMLQEERDLADFSIYAVIASDFKKEFCILVY